MSDTDGYFGPAGPPPPSGDAASIEEAVREQRERRAIAEVSGDPAAPEPEPEPSARKITDDGTDKLSVREAGRRLAELRRAGQERAAGYREGLTDPAGEPPRPAGDPSDAAVAAESLEAERAHYRQERAAQQALAGLSGTEQQLWAAEQELGQRIVAATNEFNQKYADVTSADVVARMAQTDPARHAAFVQEYGVLQAAAEQLGQFQQQRGAVAQQRVAVGTQEFHRVAELHDQAFMAEHPELEKDPVKFREIQVAARDYLAAKGLSQQEMEAHWSGRASFSLREKISQDILFDAVRFRMAQDRFARSHSNNKELMPVQRPGLARKIDRCLDACAEEDKRIFPEQPVVMLRRDLIKGQCRCSVIQRLLKEREQPQ